jgi:hypothetical protein
LVREQERFARKPPPPWRPINGSQDLAVPVKRGALCSRDALKRGRVATQVATRAHASRPCVRGRFESQFRLVASSIFSSKTSDVATAPVLLDYAEDGGAV